MESLATNGGNLMTTLDGAQMVSQTVSNVLGLFLQLLFDLDAFNYEKKMCLDFLLMHKTQL